MSELKPADCLPKITAEDRQFLHYNPNTQDVVDWVAGYALASIDEWNRRAQPAAPADSPMTAHRAIYFMERFQKDEKLLGPNEQAAIRFVLAILEQVDAAPADAEPSVAPEPLGWAQIGLLNGQHYLRQVYDRTPYPPPASIVRNMNLVPVFAHPPRAPSVAPEPVAWLSVDCIGERYLCFSKPMDNDPVTPLFAHPPRAPLTDEMIYATYHGQPLADIWHDMIAAAPSAKEQTP